MNRTWFYIIGLALFFGIASGLIMAFRDTHAEALAAEHGAATIRLIEAEVALQKAQSELQTAQAEKARTEAAHKEVLSFQ